MQLVWLADNDPLRIAAYERMPLIEYYISLNKKDIASRLEPKTNPKKGQKKNK